MKIFPFLNKGSKESIELENHNLTNLNNQYLMDEHTFNSMFENHPYMIFILDVNGQVVNYNPSVKKILGYKDTDLIGDCGRYLFKDYQSIRRKYLNKALKGEAVVCPVIAFTKVGNEIHLEIIYIPIYGLDNAIIGIYGVAKDVTKEFYNQKELEKLRNNLESAQQVANIGSWDYDINEDESFWSHQTYRIFGIHNTEDFVPCLEEVSKLIHPEDYEDYYKVIKASFENKHKGYEIEYRIIRQDNQILHLFEKADVMVDENNNPVRLIGTVQDITRRKNAENKLIETEQRYKNIFNNLDTCIWSYDYTSQAITMISRGAEYVTGYTPRELKKIKWDSLIYPADHEEYSAQQVKLMKGEVIYHTYRILRKDGNIAWVLGQMIPVLNSDGKIIRVDGIVSDITAQKETEEQIKHLLLYDYLTDMPNRRMFTEKVETLIKTYKNNDKEFAVMHLDIDRFKIIIETLGHHVADKLLQEFTLKIKNLLSGQYLFARLSGDEFGIILWDYSNSDYPLTIANHIIDEINQPFYIEDYELFITLSIGFSTFPFDGETKDKLLKNSAAALYRAKENGKNNIQIYSSSLNISSFKSYTLERDLRKAIENNELLLHFQPKVESSTGKIVGAEALLRWEHPEWGLISPKEFIPLAEENGYILQIGDWVLDQVCSYISQWNASNLPVVPISINLSPQRFLKNDWVSLVQKTLLNYQIDPSLLEFEITESTLIKHDKSVSTSINAVKELGIRVALDDFGTGFSSLTYLKQFPIDTIKIDQSFIKNVLEQTSDEMIIKSLIYLAKGLKMTVVAEGVETYNQLSFLKQQECDEIQGYIFSKAVDSKTFQELLRKKYLKPINYKHELANIENRRKYFRINLEYPLEAEMTLISINGKDVKLGTTKALIEDIGIGGIRFLCNINLPVRPDLLLQFETTLLEENTRVIGHIVWKEEVEDIYQYGLEFSISEQERESLVKKLNNLQIQLKNDALLPSCSFITEDKIKFLKKGSY